MRKKSEIYCVILNKCKTDKGMLADTLVVGNFHNNAIVTKIHLSTDKTKIIIDFDNDTRMITANGTDVDILERIVNGKETKNKTK